MKLSTKIQLRLFQGLAEQDSFSPFKLKDLRSYLFKPKYSILHLSLLNFILLSPICFSKLIR